MLKRQTLILAAIFAASCAVPSQAILFSGASSGGGGGGVTPGPLTTLTVIEPTSNAQTNMPFTIGLPFAPSTVNASYSVEVKDGGTTLLCDENNRASDLTPTVRNESLTCIVPSATSGEVKQLAASVVAGAPASGTDITVADITAAFTAASSYDVPVTFTNINGVAGTWTASLATALASGNSGWVNKSTNTVLGKYRSGGGLVTEYIVFAPAFKSGVADVQVHVTYDVVCYKAQRAAVSGPNPILGCKIDPIIENAYIQIASPVDDYYGLSVGTAGAVSSFANSTPAINLTLGATSGRTITVTAASSLFSLNSLGQVIANGTGVAVINGFTDATHVTANLYTNFSSTSVGSGTYTLYGINHPYAARYKFRTFFGFARNPPTVEGGKAYIGAAWNGGALTGGPATYMIAAKVLQNYVFSNSGYTNDLTAINNMGTNPMAYTGSGGQGGLMGNIFTYLQTSGQRSDIGVVPDWDIQAVKRWDANAPQVLFGNADRWATFNIAYRDQNTGLSVSPCNAGTLPNCTGSTQWVISSGFTGTAIGYPANPITPWSPSAPGFSHDPETSYMASLLTGDFFYVENQQNQASYAPRTVNSAGLGIKKTQYVAPGACCAGDDRAAAWSIRTIIDSTLLTPDSNPVLGITKAVGTAWVNNQWDDTTRGATALFVSNTGPGLYYDTDGPHWTALNNNGFSVFEAGYNSFEFAHANEQGMLSASGTTFFKWWLQNHIGIISSTTIEPKYVTRWQYGKLFNEQSACPGTQVATWAAVYESVNNNWLPGSFSLGVGFGAGGGRSPSATLTLSATSGAAINATLSAGNYLGATSYYVNKWIGTSDGGIARIVSVSDANHFVVDTTASHQYYTSSCTVLAGSPFGSTSYSNTQIYLPQPALGDPIGTDFAAYLSSPGDDYFQLQMTGALYAKEIGYAGGAVAYTTIFGWNGGNLLLSMPYKWNVGLRP